MNAEEGSRVMGWGRREGAKEDAGARHPGSRDGALLPRSAAAERSRPERVQRPPQAHDPPPRAPRGVCKERAADAGGFIARKRR